MEPAIRHRTALTTVAVFCAIVALGQATPSQAAGVRLGPDVTVQYLDLKADNARDTRILLKRILKAAGDICDPLNRYDPLSARRWESCQQELAADAVAKVNRPLLSALFERVRLATPRAAGATAVATAKQ